MARKKRSATVKPFNPIDAELKLLQIAANRVLVENYINYWLTLVPHSSLAYYMRWIFSFLSVRTGWESNVRGYLALEKLMAKDAGYFQRRNLVRALRKARVGLYNMRINGIWNFHLSYWQDPHLWNALPHETLRGARDRLAELAFGVDMAKTSFVLEMAYPLNQEVVCLDAHMVSLYQAGTGTPDKPTYNAIEKHWCDKCKELDLPSPIARHIYFDSIQGKPNTSYWSDVFVRPWPDYDPFKRRKGRRVLIA